MKPNLAEACQRILDETLDTGMEINFSDNGGITIYWNGVNRLDCLAADAAKAVKLIKQLEALGMKDC
jgi:hypothetical protein